MRKHKVSVNGETFTANRDDVLLDAALTAGVDIPHDCRIGQCGSCTVRLVDGQVHRDNSSDSGIVLACQSRIIGDARFVVEDVPSVEVVNSRVAAMAPLTADTVELRIETTRPLVYLPGQYFHIRFGGFPARCYYPTVSIERPGASKRSFHLQINRLSDGRVSNALGRQIRKGHQVTVTGPFGHAFLRPSLTNRLMLVATGTGFAAIWSIATAALAENPNRKIVVIAGGKTLESLYMSRALQRLAQYPNVEVIPTTSAPQSVTRSVRQGQPTDHMQDLTKDDIVYVCGAPPMVESVRRLAAAAGAPCYASPFVPLSWITGGEESLLSRALNWITGYGEESLFSRALSWVTGHSSQATESEPMDQRQPSYTFRELLSRVGPAQRPRPRPAPPQRAPQLPRPAPPNFGEPRPARQTFGEQRPTPQHFAEPRPAPQNFGEPNFAEPRLASQLRPPPAHPRLVETPPRAAPQQVYVPPRPQPQPSVQLQAQVEARQQAKAQLDGEPQPRPLQPAARSARPVFISIPEESQGIRAKAPTLPIWHAEPETAGGGLALPVYISIPSESEGLRAKAATIPIRHAESEAVGGGLALSEEFAASADETVLAVSDPLNLALSSESSETDEATENSETVAPESTSTFSGKSWVAGSSPVTIDAATTVRPTEANFADGIGEVGGGVGDLLNDHGIGASLRAFLQADLDHDTKRPVAVEETDVDGTPREFSTVVTMPSN